jgi:glycosyltransferase involved in cell wall biosynthesis
MVSRHQRDQYVAAYPRSAPSTEVIYNGVPTPALRNGAGVRDQADPPHVLALGLMRPDRGHRTLIDAAEHLSPHVRVLVAGDGPLREELVARARRSSGRGAGVQFLGYRSDLSALLRRADILVHPSLTDALPTAVIHALAHGVPVVASAVGGIPEIVSPDVGILVPPGESRSLANAVTELLEDPVRRQAMSVAGVRRHEMMFSAGGWAASLRDRYVNLLSQR